MRVAEEDMSSSKSGYYKHEYEAWFRTLDYIQQQNIMLKNTLANISRHDISNEMLEQLEQYQTKFLEKDTLVLLLRMDIAAHEQSIISNNGSPVADALLKRHNKLRRDMEHVEKEFNTLKYNFNNYVSGVVT